MGATLVELPSKRVRKIARRRGRDYSQALRRVFEGLFVALNIWIGLEFYLFVRYFETGGAGPRPGRPPGVEGWLPIAGLMNLKAFLATGEMPRVHPAAMILLVTFLLICWLLRKSFCSWLCPIGTLSEALWKTGRRLFGRNFRLPRWADMPLRSLKYALLGFFVYVVGGMTAATIAAFLESPYGLIADVKMLNFFRHMGTTAAVVLVALAVLSVLVKNFWCRYLCPYGALAGLASLASPLAIRRDQKTCIDCSKCARACPSLLPVDKLVKVRSPECTGCLECVAVCPVADALEMSAFRRRVPTWALAGGIAVLFVGVVGFAQLAGHWQTHLPDRVYFNLIPRAHQFQHP